MKEKAPNKPTFECRDLMLSAAILTAGVLLIGTRKNGSYLIFIFDDCDGRCDDLEKAWWMGTLEQKVTVYAESVKRLKNLIFSKK